MKPLSTRTHGILDYVTGGSLLAMPHLFRWGREDTMFLSAMAAGKLVTSALTRYELGLFKVIPMTIHLAMDAGRTLLFLGWCLRTSRADVRAAMIGCGLMELGAALMTGTKTSDEHRPFAHLPIPEAIRSHLPGR